jgi:phosphoribosylanthranilate isomerase
MMKRPPIKLKVCGMRDAANIREISALKPDYMGFIFYERSPRFVGSQYQFPDLVSDIKKVGVFVNASTSDVMEKHGQYGLDFLQLHGNESVAQVKELKNEGVRIFKVFSVDDSFDFEVTRPYEEYSDYFLFDTKGKYFGGNALRFDWRILENYNQSIPFLLSGGITPEAVSDVKVLKGMNLHALDVNSGVELSPGLKDGTKVTTVKAELEKINN